MALATWESMEALEGTVVDLATLPPLRQHTMREIDITLGHLARTGEVILQAYGDHYMKVAWATAFASLDKARWDTWMPSLPAPLQW